VDASLLKDSGDRAAGLQFRAEALNVINHANFANPDTRNGVRHLAKSPADAGNQSQFFKLALHLQF